MVGVNKDIFNWLFSWKQLRVYQGISACHVNLERENPIKHMVFWNVSVCICLIELFPLKSMTKGIWPASIAVIEWVGRKFKRGQTKVLTVRWQRDLDPRSLNVAAETITHAHM